jgi:hypothetical protein
MGEWTERDDTVRTDHGGNGEEKPAAGNNYHERQLMMMLCAVVLAAGGDVRVGPLDLEHSRSVNMTIRSDPSTGGVRITVRRTQYNRP